MLASVPAGAAATAGTAASSGLIIVEGETAASLLLLHCFPSLVALAGALPHTGGESSLTAADSSCTNQLSEVDGELCQMWCVLLARLLIDSRKNFTTVR